MRWWVTRQGEIAAACVAGILTLEDAARVVALRSRALSGLGAQGGMVSVVMPAAAVRELLEPWAERLSVAAVNGPAATVVSGDLEALAEFEAELSARRVMRWRIPETDFVAHSARVEELEQPLLAAELALIRAAAGAGSRCSPRPSRRWLDGTELDAAYWYANVRDPVRFADAVGVLAGSGHRVFIEVSPHPVLTPAVADTIETPGTGPTPVISGTTAPRERRCGARSCWRWPGPCPRASPVDWAAVARRRPRVDLPTYAVPAPALLADPRAAPGPGRGGRRRRDSDRPGGGRGFWAAVEDGDLPRWPATLAVDEPARAERGAAGAGRRGGAGSGTGRTRRVALPGHLGAGRRPRRRPRLSGTWLLVAPVGADARRTGCVRALAARGAHVGAWSRYPPGAGPGRRWPACSGGAGEAGPATAGGAVAGVVSLLALDETADAAGSPVVPGGLARHAGLVQALGDAGIDAPLWVRHPRRGRGGARRGADQPGAGAGLGPGPGRPAWSTRTGGAA